MVSDRPRLLMLTSSFPRNPSDETCGYLRDFARTLASEFDVEVLAPGDADAVWPTDAFKLKRSPLLLGKWDPFRGSRDLNELPSRSLLTKLALSFSVLLFSLMVLRSARRADVICSHWMLPSGLIGSLAARLLSKPHVIVEHSGALHLLARARGGSWLARFIVRRTRRLTVVSSRLRDKLTALCPEASGRIEVIPMGVTFAGQRQTEEEQTCTLRGGEGGALARTILFVGRLVEIKGLDVLLRAIEGVARCRLLIAGEGEQREELEELADELGVDACFMGQVNAAERERLLALADVVVIPSRMLPNGRTEGTPVVCLEALAAGRPVIASRVGGLPEIISDGENGLLVEPGNHLKLREKLKAVLAEQTLSHKLGLNARRTAGRFGWSQVGTRFAEVIDSALKEEWSERRRSKVRSPKRTRMT